MPPAEQPEGWNLNVYCEQPIQSAVIYSAICTARHILDLGWLKDNGGEEESIKQDVATPLNVRASSPILMAQWMLKA